MAKATPRVTKRRVTMTNNVLPDGTIVPARAVDYVPAEDTADGSPNILDAYVADAKTRWQFVEVSDEPDAGPGGYEGATTIPPRLAHPAAGTTYPATNQEG